MQLSPEPLVATVARSTIREPAVSADSSLKKYAFLAPLSLLWFSLFAVLSTDWSINSQYSYGWIVPFLSLAVLMQRWSSRPAPWPRAHPFLPGILAVVFFLAALPLRWLEEANPEWRLILWLHALIATGISLLWFGYTGGLRWVRHFTFPMLFPLISVPLPMGIENGLIQGLTKMVSAASAELALMMSIPAVQHGNLIEVSTGVLGVEEACSGIRSLQSCLLVALFLGEHYRLGFFRRVSLTLVGFAIAILGNIARTYFLVSVAASQTVAAADALHDKAAMVSLVAGLALLFLGARLFRTSTSNESEAGSLLPGRPLAPAFSLASCLWLGCIWIGVEFWYRAHEMEAGQKIRWSVVEPSAENQFKAVEIPERSRAILRYSSGHSMSWRDNAAHAWRLYYLRWEPGRNSAQLAKAHTPEICLSGAGGKVQGPALEHTVTVGPLELHFKQLAFDFGGKTLHVFYCLWDDYPRRRDPSSEDGSQRSRVMAALNGQRHLGQTVLEIGVQGPESPSEARAAFERQIEQLIRH